MEIDSDVKVGVADAEVNKEECKVDKDEEYFKVI